MTSANARLTARGEGELRLATGLPPLVAFGRAVGHLMTRPAFAGAPFGHVARALAGQVNRGHYAFAERGDAIVGFAGWALADEAAAETWLSGTAALPGESARAGDCVILNFWQADAPEVSRFLVGRLARHLTGKRRLYGRRHYSDGRIRPLRIALSGR
jgi:hemolysin-activating ACP:hemolysin acyltransferase